MPKKTSDKDKVKIRFLVEKKNLKIGEVAKCLGRGWTPKMVSSRIHDWGIKSWYSRHLQATPFTEKQQRKLVDLIVFKKMRHVDAAKEMGANWNVSKVMHRCQQLGITNQRHGGQRWIPEDELIEQKKLMDKGFSYATICSMINKMFGKSYTRSTISARAKQRNWKNVCSMAGEFPKYSKDEEEIIKALHKLGAPRSAYIQRLQHKHNWHSISKKIDNMVETNQLKSKDKPLPKQMVRELQKAIRS